MHIRGALLKKGGRGQHKMCFKRGGSGEFEHSLPPFAQALPPLNNDAFLRSDGIAGDIMNRDANN